MLGNRPMEEERTRGSCNVVQQEDNYNFIGRVCKQIERVLKMISERDLLRIRKRLLKSLRHIGKLVSILANERVRMDGGTFKA